MNVAVQSVPLPNNQQESHIFTQLKPMIENFYCKSNTVKNIAGVMVHVSK